MRPGYKRSLRIAGLLKRQISRLVREELKDPDIGEMTIIEVIVSNDLRIAKIYISSLEDEEHRQRTLEGLKRATSFIRGKLGVYTELRYIPELRFFYDRGAEHAEKIDKIIKHLHDNE